MKFKHEDTIIIPVPEQFQKAWEPIVHKPTQPRMPPISIGGGIGEQCGENKRILFTLN